MILLEHRRKVVPKSYAKTTGDESDAYAKFWGITNKEHYGMLRYFCSGEYSKHSWPQLFRLFSSFSVIDSSRNSSAGLAGPS